MTERLELGNDDVKYKRLLQLFATCTGSVSPIIVYPHAVLNVPGIEHQSNFSIPQASANDHFQLKTI